MSTKRLTLQEAQQLLVDGPQGGTVWSLNYDPNGIPGDWTGMQPGDELVEQYGPFVLTTEGENEAIDTSVLTFDEQIAYQSDRVEYAGELGLDQRKQIERLVDIVKASVISSYEHDSESHPDPKAIEALINSVGTNWYSYQEGLRRATNIDPQDVTAALDWLCVSCRPDVGWTKWAGIEADMATGEITLHAECGHCGWSSIYDRQGNLLDD